MYPYIILVSIILLWYNDYDGIQVRSLVAYPIATKILIIK